MKQKHKTLFIILLLMPMFSWNCHQRSDVYQSKQWFTMVTTYEGLPLFIRKPDIINIFENKSIFPYLFILTHTLDHVKENGLPEDEYNISMMEFDSSVTELFDSKSEGYIFLIETFSGERNYYFYLSDQKQYAHKINILRKKFPNYKISNNSPKLDSSYDFIKKYPFSIY